MIKFILIPILVFFSISIVAQIGPHHPEEQIRYVKFSESGDRYITIAGKDIALWETETGNILWVKKFTDFKIPEVNNWVLFPIVDKELNRLYINDNRKYILNFETGTGKELNGNLVAFLPNNKLLIVQDFTSIYSVINATTHEVEAELGKYISVIPADGGKKLVAKSLKKTKIYDIDAGKWVKALDNTDNVNSQAAVHPFRETHNVIGEYEIKYNYSTKKINITKGEESKLPDLIPGAKNDPKCISINKEKQCIYILEFKVDASQYPRNFYQSYLTSYAVPSGEVLWRRELNKDATQAKKEGHEVDLKKKKEQEALLANIDPGLKIFDAQFTNLSIPYTLNYDNATGFDITYNAYITKSLYPKNGTSVYGMGRICSCSGNYSYLVMMRTKDQYKDLSNFIVISFGPDGKSSGSQNIGTTQKDAAGIVKSIFTISGAGCNYSIATTKTWPNGHVEKKNTQISNCKVSY